MIHTDYDVAKSLNMFGVLKNMSSFPLISTPKIYHILKLKIQVINKTNIKSLKSESS